MREMKKYLSLIVGFMLTVVATLTGATGNVIMAAAASDLPDAGKTTAGDGVESVDDVKNSGASSVTHIEEYADEDFHVTDLDTKIMKIRPMSTPLEQITRGKGGRHIRSMVTKYYSVDDTRSGRSGHYERQGRGIPERRPEARPYAEGNRR